MTLWRLAALNPALCTSARTSLCKQLQEFHILTVDKLCNKTRGNAANSTVAIFNRADIDNFSGFKPAIEACHLDWNDYVLRPDANASGFFPRPKSWMMSLCKIRSDGESNRIAHAKGHGRSPVSSSMVSTAGMQQRMANYQIAASDPAGAVVAEASGSDEDANGLNNSGSGSELQEQIHPSNSNPNRDSNFKNNPGKKFQLPDKADDIDSDCGGSVPSTPSTNGSKNCSAPNSVSENLPEHSTSKNETRRSSDELAPIQDSLAAPASESPVESSKKASF